MNRNAAKCVLDGVRATFDGWNRSIEKDRILLQQYNAIADDEDNPNSENAKLNAQEMRIRIAYGTNSLRKCVAKAFELEALLEDATSTDEAIEKCMNELILAQA